MGKLGRLTSKRISSVRPWDHQPYTTERLADLLKAHVLKTGEHIRPDARVLDFVPLMQEFGKSDQDRAVWLIVGDDNSAKMLIERPASDDHAVDVVLDKLGEYNNAHRQLVQLMIAATKHNRANALNSVQSENDQLMQLRDAAEAGVDAACLARRDVTFAHQDAGLASSHQPRSPGKPDVQ